MASSGFEWLTLPKDSSVEQSHTPPPPPVSFGTGDHSVEEPAPVPEIDFKNLFSNMKREAAVSSVPTSGMGLSPVLGSSSGKTALKSDSTVGTSNNSNNINAISNANTINNNNTITNNNTISDTTQTTTNTTTTSNNNTITNNNNSANTDTTPSPDIILKNFKDNTAIPLSLTVQQLSSKETKTYLRWYNDIISRRGTRTITLSDVFIFLKNFRILDLHKKLIHKIFQSCAESLNIGQFFCLLRIISHSIMSGKLPSRELIKQPSAIPKPVSILSRKRHNNDILDNSDADDASSASNNLSPHSASPVTSQSSQLNLDSFAQFMLTGHRPTEPEPGAKKKSKSKKKVKFSDTVEIDPRATDEPPAPVPSPAPAPSALDLSLPMEQLLGRISQGSPQPLLLENEEEELKDMQDSINHFQNVNIDSVSIDGVPANIPSNYFSYSPLGVASPQKEDSPQPHPLPLQPNLTGSVSKSMRQGLGITSPPPPPPRLRSASSPDHLLVPLGAQPVRRASPLSNSTMSPPPPPPRFRSSTLPGQLQAPSPGYRSPVPPPPPSRPRKNSALGQQAPPLPPKIEIKQPTMGFEDYFKNGAVHRSTDDVLTTPVMPTASPGQQPAILSNNSSSSDILNDLKALKVEVDRIKYLSGNGY